MRTSKRWVCALLIGLHVAACATDNDDTMPDAAVGDAPDAAVPELDFTEFDEAVEAYMASNNLEGINAVVVHADWGIVHARSYGSFDLSRVSLIASASKPLSVGVLMRLVDQGLLDVDAPIGAYLDEAWGADAATDADKTEITVAQLVSNSAGLPGLLDNPTYAPYLCQYLPNGTLTDCARSIYGADDTAERSAPDTEFRYGGGQWQLAGGLAEVVSGKDWDTLVQETYVDPCQTASLGYTNQFTRAAGEGGGGTSYPRFFMADIANLDVTDNPSIEGGAYITAEDYGRILLMHLRDGHCGDTRVLSSESVARMQVDRIEAYGGMTIDPTLAGYGLGWWISRTAPGLVASAGAYGAMPWLDMDRGYGAFLALEAEASLGVLLRLETQPILEDLFDSAR